MAKSCGAAQPGADRFSYPLVEQSATAADSLRQQAQRLVQAVAVFRVTAA